MEFTITEESDLTVVALKGEIDLDDDDGEVAPA